MPYASIEAKREYQRRWVRERRQEYLESFGNKCQKCDSTESLEFHHRDEKEKISHKVWSWSRERIDKELAKCDLLCMECHREMTKAQFGWFEYIHGTLTCYKRTLCQCDLCKKANADYELSRRKIKKDKFGPIAHLGERRWRLKNGMLNEEAENLA